MTLIFVGVVPGGASLAIAGLAAWAAMLTALVWAINRLSGD